MKQLYFAYLQNTPGSKKALEECLKEVEVRGGSRKANQKKRKLNRADNEKVENSNAESASNQADEMHRVTNEHSESTNTKPEKASENKANPSASQNEQPSS